MNCLPQIVSVTELRNNLARRLEQFELLAEARRNEAKAEADPSTVMTHAEVKRRIAAKIVADVEG